MNQKLLYGLTTSQSIGFLRGQAEFMVDRGYEVHVVASPGPAREGDSLLGVAIHHLPMVRDVNLIEDFRSLLLWIKVMARIRPDVVNLSTPKAALLGSIAAAILRVPKRVYVVRGLRYEGELGFKRRLLIAFERLICVLSTDIVVVSRSVGRSMRSEGVTSKSLTLIGSGSSNGVDYRRWRSRVEEVDQAGVKSELGIPSGNLVLLFVGRLTADKGISTVIDMAEALDDSMCVSIVLVGPAESSDVAETLKRAGVAVKIVGPQRDVAPFYAIADVLLLPTRREGFPNVVLEAGAVGVPVITTDATGAVDSVVDGVTGLVVPVDDGEAMAGAVEKLAKSLSIRKDMGKAAKRRVEAEFRPEFIWSGLAAVYDGSDSDLLSHV